jgi:uncharacterized membrane protein YbhN (UPF0104 family)
LTALWPPSRAAQVGAGLSIGALFFWLSARETTLGEISHVLVNASPLWLLAGMALYAADLAVRIVRWQALLRPCADLPYRSIARVLLVGYGVNTLLPARLGELFRAEFFKRSYGVSRSIGLASVALERLLDGVVVVACLAAGLWLAGGGESDAALLTLCLSGAALFIAFAGGLAFASWMARHDWMQSWKPLQSRADDVRAALAVARTPAFVGAGLLTLAIYALEAGALGAILAALGVAPTATIVLVVIGAASLSTLLPSAPGFIGTYQFAFSLALVEFGFDPAIGVAAATMVQSLLFGPVALIAVVILSAGRRTAAKAPHVV